MKRTIETLVAAGLLLGGALSAQDKKESAPAAPQADKDKKQELEATIVALKGTVDVKRPEDKDWVAAERNMKLKKGSEICTAVAATAKLLFNTGTTGSIQVDVKPLTQAKIEELVKSGAKVNADVNLKYGAIEVDIQKGDIRSDMKVTAPNSTTSVSGSHGFVRAPASGGGRRITLRTTSGRWTRYLNMFDVEQTLEGDGSGDDWGDLPKDLFYRLSTDEYLNFFGKSDDELFQSGFTNKAGDSNPWDIPLSEFGGNWPGSPKGKKPSALPLPPPPPFP